MLKSNMHKPCLPPPLASADINQMSGDIFSLSILTFFTALIFTLVADRNGLSCMRTQFFRFLFYVAEVVK